MRDGGGGQYYDAGTGLARAPTQIDIFPVQEEARIKAVQLFEERAANEQRATGNPADSSGAWGQKLGAPVPGEE